MINQELIINGQRINLGVNFGVRLNRQLLNPAELNTKDAQFSYNISVPTGGVNDVAFKYSSIEETRDKFNRLYTAEYSVNGIRVFKGNFKLTSVTAKAYKGNLYVPAAKTIKDIFGEIKLNQNPELRIPFSDFALSINQYNVAAAIEPQYAIFPYTLYGVLPKVPLDRNANNYSARTLWDASVKLGLADLPPSINALLMLKHIFNAQGYALGGSAFDDERLTGIYLSYKNASDYVQPWNYGYHASMHVHGAWSTRDNKRTGATNNFERGAFETYDNTGKVYVADLFDAMNTNLVIDVDSGGNITSSEVEDVNGKIWLRAQMRIPTAGFYKVSLDMSLKVSDVYGLKALDNVSGIQHVGGRSDNADNDFEDNLYELRLVRDYGKGDFNLSGAVLDGLMYRNNLPQNMTFDADNIPKYFPQVPNTGQLNFVDSAQDRNIVLGFQYGRHRDASVEFLNPKDINSQRAQILAAKPSISWDASNNDPAPRLAIKSAGYWKYGKIGQFEQVGDNPYLNIDYSGGEVRRRALDANGQPLMTLADTFALLKFPLETDFTYVIDANVAGYEGNVYVHANGTVMPALIIPFVAGSATFDATGIADVNISLYIKTEDADATDTLTISKVIPAGDDDIIDWETTNKYAINLINAPQNEVRKGRFNNADAAAIWNGQGKASAVVWFEAGELLTLASVSSEGRYRQDGDHSSYGWSVHDVLFDLQVTPFRTDAEWLKVGFNGNGTAVMDWNDTTNFDVSSIDLVGFLSADMKTDDFIDNFCKAFNLRLSQSNLNTYALDVKQSKTAVSSRFVNLDKIATVKDRENTPLGLPSIYKLGFTVDAEEQGYVETGDNGGGEYETGAVEESIVEQKSSFSYNWLKTITKVEAGGNIPIPIAVISKSDVWAATMPYPEAMRKRYTDLAYRFWYFDGWLNTLGATFNFNGSPLTIARVSNEIPNVSILNYKNALHTILDNFFTVLINGSSHYTELEAYLTAGMYAKLDGSIMAMFNGDLYFIAELSGYDPAGKNKTNIKLIRKL